MIDTDKYEGHTPADEWRLVFSKGVWNTSGFHHKQMDGFSVKVYDLRQMQVCDPEDYLVAQANQDLAKDAPLLLAEVKRLRKALLQIAGTANGRPFVSGNIGLPFVHEVFKELIE